MLKGPCDWIFEKRGSLVGSELSVPRQDLKIRHLNSRKSDDSMTRKGKIKTIIIIKLGEGEISFLHGLEGVQAPSPFPFSLRCWSSGHSFPRTQGSGPPGAFSLRTKESMSSDLLVLPLLS